MRPIKALINLKSVDRNIRVIKNYSNISKITAVVKANAYGHGISNVIEALSQVDSLAVSSLEEAVELRKITNKDIVLLEGFFCKKELSLIEKHKFQIVLHSFEQLRFFLDSNFKINIWLKVNTGMNRLGFEIEDLNNVCKQIEKRVVKTNILGIVNHLACSDEPNHYINKNQIKAFEKLRKKGFSISLSNSAAILSGIFSEWIRPGISLYGVSPFSDGSIGRDFGLSPVMTLVSELISIRNCKKGDIIGYGAEYRCPENMLVGVAAAGYGDGYPRHASIGTPVLIKNTLVKLIGRVCMDMIFVNLQQCKNAKVGDQVVLWGENLPIEVVSKYAKTIPNQLLAGITSRVPRCIIETC